MSEDRNRSGKQLLCLVATLVAMKHFFLLIIGFLIAIRVASGNRTWGCLVLQQVRSLSKQSP